ncbi:MAG: putative DNA-binding domain-containing protein [Methylobacter sp.]|uniref:HvfC family RiPP maturation protein n=1 Tax=Methylobacter sp. TaxID=2051955 RepID=UPI0027317509|nr:putative DNA-binding domain-containing protein [Methylobacter sp.]MDP1665274.1 putative DNA-binding domain-containing protein [Methylobacter sp.]
MNAEIIPAFQVLQRQFLAHLRDPKQQPLPAGFARQDVGVYVDLLYNKFNDSLETCFPVTHSILGETAWQKLLKTFIARHRCLSPYYRQIPDEFVLYLQNESQAADNPPFLAELAHFEWMELILSIAEAEPVATETLSDEQLMDAPLVFTPVMRLLHYVWPVQQISRTYQPDEPPSASTHILGFRDSTDRVQFIALNPATAGLVLRLQKRNTATQVLQELGKDLTASELSNLLLFGKSILADLHRQGAIIGIHSH